MLLKIIHDNPPAGTMQFIIPILQKQVIHAIRGVLFVTVHLGFTVLAKGFLLGFDRVFKDYPGTPKALSKDSGWGPSF
ncbi:hypothetical protein [Flavihumibacter sp.]|uniref:hypothetical protein n=1 Tax=Flavihumibacter sp. TaxID=1913981 RepID=UPI002FCAC735